MCLFSKPLRDDGFVTCDEANAFPIAGIGFAKISNFKECSTNAVFLDVLFDPFLAWCSLNRVFNFHWSGSARVFGYSVFRGVSNRVYGILRLKYGYSVYQFL